MFPQLGIPVPPNFEDEKQAAGRRQTAQVTPPKHFYFSNSYINYICNLCAEV